MKNLIIFTLLSALSCAANSECTQSDLAGRWEFHSGSVGCRFFIDEEGHFNRGQCWKYTLDGVGTPGGGLVTIETPLGPIYDSSLLSINRHCRVEGGFWTRANTDRSILGEFLKIGRLNTDKSMVAGLSGSFADFENGESRTFTMVRY